VFCFIVDEPGKTGNLKATDWDKNHVDLKWTTPKDAGGSITGYIVEKRINMVSGRKHLMFQSFKQQQLFLI
jgi:hypothetical protein